MRIDKEVAKLLEKRKGEIAGLFLVLASKGKDGKLNGRVTIGGNLEEVGAGLAQWLTSTENQEVAQAVVDMLMSSMIVADKVQVVQGSDVPMMVAGKEGEA